MSVISDTKEAEDFLKLIKMCTSWGLIETHEAGLILIYIDDAVLKSARFPAMLESMTKEWLLFLHRFKVLTEQPQIMSKRTLD